MKIGILTFHCAHNYGAVLQCYATQEFLRSKGFEVEIINYRPDYLLQPYQLFDYRRILNKNVIHSLKSIIVEILLFRIRYKRWRAFERFINQRILLSNVVTRQSIPGNYDAYIVGSDQIWNSQITRGFDDIYFCNFPFIKASKKYIAYAASMEACKLDYNSLQFCKTKLNNFDAVSVREKELLSLFRGHVNIPIKQVLDPTLMVSPELWNRFSKMEKIKRKYVVVYQVRHNLNTLRIANHIAKQIGAEVLVLVAWLQLKSKKTFQNASPEDFINIIRNAAFVVTTSFHGTAFSIIFNRSFYTIKLNDGADSRSSSLLNSLGLEDRMINMDDSPRFSEVDYATVNSRLDILRQQSQDFLLNSLNDE